MNDQLLLKFPRQQVYKKEDFYVSPSNQEAYDFINSWPKWIKQIINIFGPSGSGKSHLTSILQSKTSCLKIECNEIKDNTFFDPSLLTSQTIEEIFELPMSIPTLIII